MKSGLVKNSLILMFRMIIVMGITLYSSRVLLNNLGVTNFGIYNIVASTIVLFSFIQSSLSGASSRFLTYELGKNSSKDYLKVLNGALSIHLYIAISLLVAGELIGTYIINQVLNIPSSLLLSANIVFQFSLISTLVVLINIPFESVLVSHEKFSSFAYISLFDVFLKLISAFLIGFIDNVNDRILYYSLFLLISTVVVKFLQRFLALQVMGKYSFFFVKDRSFLKPIFSFFGWDLFGNLSLVIKDQGVYIIQNVFFGVLINAATAISGQVFAAISALSTNVLVAVKPQIIKSYANNEFVEMNILINRFSRISFYLMLFISIPLFFNIDFFLKTWLDNVPKDANVFAKLNILVGLFTVSFLTLNHAIHATGRIKTLSIVSGGLYILIFPVTYLLYKIGYSPSSYYYVMIFFCIIAAICNMYFLKIVLPQFDLKSFITNTVVRIVTVLFLSFVISYYSYQFRFFLNDFLNIFLLSVVNYILMSFIIFCIDIEMREYIKKIITKKFF
ncbi:hypothetical protein ACK1KB_00610 [Chryseobacterium sp. TY3]